MIFFLLLLRYCGRRSSRYFILMQYKLKMLQFIPNAPSTFLWAMSDAHSHQFCSKAWSNPLANQWIVQFLAESSEAVLTQSCNRKFKNIKSTVPGEMPLPRHNYYWYFHNIYPCRNIGYICLHYAEQTEEDPPMCICLVMFRCSVAVMWGINILWNII